MPPVEVPAMTSKSFAIGFCVDFSIAARTVPGMRPRMPPPSMERILSIVCVPP